MNNKYAQLVEFLDNQMRMSHVYQPVMMIELLRSNGRASVTQIAKALLGYDVSQIEYYENVTKNMVGKVLTRSRGLTEKSGQTYELKDFGSLTDEQVNDLVARCLSKIDSFISKKG